MAGRRGIGARLISGAAILFRPEGAPILRGLTRGCLILSSHLVVLIALLRWLGMR